MWARRSHPEKLNTIVSAFVLHESAHSFYTNMILLKVIHQALPHLIGEKEATFVGELLNTIEDARVEFWYGTEFPSAVEKFRATSLFLFSGKEPSKNIYGAIQCFILVFFRALLKTGNPSEIIREMFEGKFQRVLLDIFDATAIKTLVEAGRARTTTDTFLRVLKLYHHIKDVLVSHFSDVFLERQLKEYLGGRQPLLLRLLKKNLSKVLDSLFPRLPSKLREKIKNSIQEGIFTLRDLQKRIKKIGKKHGKPAKRGGAGKGGSEVTISDYKDRMFYEKTKRNMQPKIKEMRQTFKELKTEWEKNESRWGDLPEDELLSAYEWSLVRDEPRPRIFRGYRKEMPQVDFFLLLDESGSMTGKPAQLCMESSVIISEVLRPILSDAIQLSVATFGSEVRIVKAFNEAIEAGRYYPHPRGGTEIFKSLRLFYRSQRGSLQEGSWKIFFVFSDTINYDPDDEAGDEILGTIRGKEEKTIFIIISTKEKQLSRTTEKFDINVKLQEISELDSTLSRVISKLLNRISARPQ